MAIKDKNIHYPLDQALIEIKMKKVKHILMVMSGKGGVGKTTVAVNIATQLALEDKKVGLLDIDIHGPNVPKTLGIEDKRMNFVNNSLTPVEVISNLKVVSMAFLLKEKDDPVIWRGPLKMGIIKQFLKDVTWGKLDYLIIDAPPGTGDEPLSIAQLVNRSKAIIVTTPQELALLDAQKAISFCKQLNMEIVGIVENMSGFVCSHCKNKTEIFKSGSGINLVRKYKIPFLGQIPIDPSITEAGDKGYSICTIQPESETSRVYKMIVSKIQKLLE